MTGRTRGPVLVVDDDADIREAIVELLREEGHEAIGAAHGGHALEALEKGPRPSLILLDLMMPVMDGMTFRQRQLDDLRYRDIPVALISAFRDVEEKAASMRADAVLRKPIDLPDLYALVKRFTNGGSTG